MLVIYFKGSIECFPDVKGLLMKGGSVRIITPPDNRLHKLLYDSGCPVKVVHTFETIGKQKRKVLEVDLNNSDLSMEFNVEPVEEPGK